MEVSQAQGDTTEGSDQSPAVALSTPVDGVHVLGALSPSRAADFMVCPLLYRFRTVDRLPEPFSPDAVRGTLVHKVLEDLFDLPADQRTPDRARDLLAPSWDALLTDEPALAEMLVGAEDDQLDFAGWFASCAEVLDRYFTLEDPRRLEPAERELYVEALLDSKLLLRGFVDRLDEAPDGRLRVVDYKGLALDTPLPTPGGWTTMEDVRVGDALLGSDGRPTLVLEKSGTHHRPCYRVTFADGSSVVCDNVHLWSVVTTHRQRRVSRTVDTDALLQLHQQNAALGLRKSLWVEAAHPVKLPEVELPVDPWLLGAWLGDGDSRSGQLTVGSADVDDMMALVKEHWPRHVSASKELTAWRLSLSRHQDQCTYGHNEFKPPTPGHQSRRCRHEGRHQAMAPVNVTFTSQLRDLGVLGRKHIPPAYLRSGHDQRLALLRGLMDTDGWWNRTRRRAGFTITDDLLARQVVELLRTVGAHPQHFVKPYVNAVRPNRNMHVIEFTPAGFNPFSLPRKALACDGAISEVQRAWSSRRIIRSVEPVESVPTQCVAVDSADSLYLCGEGFVPTHNTGRAPGEGFEAKALFQMKFYALALWRSRGVVPSMLQLVYLGNAEMLRYEPDEADLEATERKIVALWQAIRRAEEDGDWRASPSRMCDWCAHKSLCPAYGGTPPPLPVTGPPTAAEDPAGDLETVQELTGQP